MSATTMNDRPVFSRGAIIAWGRSIGIPDNTALEFMRQEGAIIQDEQIERSQGIGRELNGTSLQS